MTNDFDLPTIRKQLDAMRAKHGADSPIGHRYSNLIEQLKSYQRATGLDGDPFMTSDQRVALEKNITKSVADLAKLNVA